MAMNINDSFRFMQGYRINDIPKADDRQVLLPEPKPQEQPKQSHVTIEPLEDKRPKTTDPAKVSLSFNKNEHYGYIGRDKDLSTLDMEKAISMMRQDSILQDYQYFVGSSKNIFSSEDGTVIAKENKF